ncbi:MAG: hypothetical protein KAJ95_08780 [Gammaproteobacteria bacterium]|nr:hypothetical protein [Gammaproteobacteria bacterium]
MNLSCKAVVVISLSLSSGLVFSDSAFAQNPWQSGSRPLIDEGSQISTKRNTWQDKTQSATADEFDESKYPPLDENRTLGTGEFDELTKNPGSAFTSGPSSLDTLQQFDPQSLGEVPTYPGSSRSYSGSNYDYYQNPGLSNRYQSGAWSGNRGMNNSPFGGGYGNGFPFGGNGSGFPFGGSNGSAFPFSGGNGSGFPFGGGNNGWMPFSNSGFW